MKRLVLAVIVLLVIASTAFGDIARPDYFRKRKEIEEDDLLITVPQGSLTLNVRVSESEDNTLVMYMIVYGKGTWSYKINNAAKRNAAKREYVASGAGETSGSDKVTKTWQYELPEQGKSLRYAVGASFRPDFGKPLTARKQVTIRNVKGVIQIVIE